MKLMFMSFITLILSGVLGAPQARAIEYSLPPDGSRLVGQHQTYTTQEGDRSLQAIARRFDTAAMIVLEANNTLAPVPKPGTQVLIPLQLLLPDMPREGIVVNLAELRLYYFPPDGKSVQVYPLGIGKLGLETPEMVTHVGQKIPNPSWTPTEGIRQRSRIKGVMLPPVVPPGPHNPLGRFALRLAYDNGEYLIHGTNEQSSVGLRVSSGCMRMFTDDIKALFSQVQVGTPVRVINQPVKFAIEPNGSRYMEVHRPLSKIEKQNTQTMHYTLPVGYREFASDKGTDKARVDRALSRRAGYPVVVSDETTPAATGSTEVLSVQNDTPEAVDEAGVTQ